MFQLSFIEGLHQLLLTGEIVSHSHTGEFKYAWFVFSFYPISMSPSSPSHSLSLSPLQRRHSLFGSSYQSWSCFSRNLTKKKQSRWKSSNRSEFTVCTPLPPFPLISTLLHHPITSQPVGSLGHTIPLQPHPPHIL